MKKMILILLVPALFAACTKESNCLKSTGKITVEERYTEDFNAISLNDNIDVVLINSDKNLIEVKAGENIIDGISTEVIDTVLIIENRNKCNWLRDLDTELKVLIYRDSIRDIQYNSTAELSTMGQYQTAFLNIEVWNGAGSIRMDIDAYEMTLAQHSGAVDFHMNGNSRFLRIYSVSYGPFFCDEMDVDYLDVVSRSSNDCYVRANLRLTARIEAKGNVYYRGNPEILSWEDAGEGELIYLGD